MEPRPESRASMAVEVEVEVVLVTEKGISSHCITTRSLRSLTDPPATLLEALFSRRCEWNFLFSFFMIGRRGKGSLRLPRAFGREERRSDRQI